jgi:23S rRNA G2445 N2-methylase RlmL
MKYEINKCSIIRNTENICANRRGTEEIGAEEFKELGARNVKLLYRGLQFEADPRTLFAINYHSRLATRILAPLLDSTATARIIYIKPLSRSIGPNSLALTRPLRSLRR